MTPFACLRVSDLSVPERCSAQGQPQRREDVEARRQEAAPNGLQEHRGRETLCCLLNIKKEKQQTKHAKKAVCSLVKEGQQSLNAHTELNTLYSCTYADTHA